MLAVTLTIGTLVSIMMFFVGGVVGWLAKEHAFTTQPIYTHPEMFDENGNVLPDEILAVRFENGYDYEDEQRRGSLEHRGRPAPTTKAAAPRST